MNPERKVVALGAASGVAVMLASVAILTWFLSAPATVDSIPERLAYALEFNVIALIPLFVMLIVVGNARFLSAAIDPTRHTETARMEIDGRVVENTLQQNFVFAITSLSLSTLLPEPELQVIMAVTIVFVLARIAFWIGYRKNPLYRAPGMAATAYLNLGMILAVLYYMFLA